jgi:hypothetical protein
MNVASVPGMMAGRVWRTCQSPFYLETVSFFKTVLILRKQGSGYRSAGFPDVFMKKNLPVEPALSLHDHP